MIQNLSATGTRLQAMAVEYPNKQAFAEVGEHGDVSCLSFHDWHQRALHCGKIVDQLGLMPGDRVALILESPMHFAPLYTGLMDYGCVVSGMDAKQTASTHRQALDQLNPKLLISSSPRSADIVSPSVARLSTDEVEDLWRDPSELTAATAPSQPEAPCAIVWTSGTTGRPKGVVTSQSALEFAGSTYRSVLGPDDRYLAALPLTHGNFMTKVYANVLIGFTQLVVTGRWTPERVLRTIAEHEVTVLGAIAGQLRELVRHPDFESSTSSLRRVVFGGSYPSPGLVEEVERRCSAKVTSRYGSTESAVATGTDADDTPSTIESTVGRPHSGVDIEVRREGRAVEVPGESGTIFIKSPGVTLGYWDGEELDVRPLDGGWLETGDVGAWDSNGYLTLIGRGSAQVLMFDGKIVYAAEVERSIWSQSNTDDIAVVSVPGLTDRDLLIAFFVPRSILSVDCGYELMETLANDESCPIPPDRIVVTDELPLTTNYKRDRSRLRRWAIDQWSERDDSILVAMRAEMITREGETLVTDPNVEVA